VQFRKKFQKSSGIFLEPNDEHNMISGNACGLDINQILQKNIFVKWCFSGLYKTGGEFAANSSASNPSFLITL
jgi:hypothetical protein